MTRTILLKVLNVDKLEEYNITYILCDQVCQWLAASQWFSLGTPVSSTSRIDHHNITKILLKVALSTITLTPQLILKFWK
jgi:hypothetical protein